MTRISLPVVAVCLFALGVMAAPARAAPAAPAAVAARVAVLVGANGAAPGRKPLYYSHRDVDRMSEVLLAVGGFTRANVLVLKDPTPAALLRALEAASARLAGRPDSLLYFFYSGHADEVALYPGGHPVPLVRVRGIIDDARVSVKIGVVDACRGGSWTRAKGLVADEPFAVRWPLSLDNEGSVLIASSSGQESAHESDQLQGSFFTYHFTGGLRGAADRNADGVVTLSEGFEYAKEQTIRDTLRHTQETQRPSYAVNLRGRRDLVLTQVMSSPSTLAVDQKEGPLELVHAESGLRLLELPPGPRQVKLAVPPGAYLVRRRLERGNLVRELVVAAGAHSTIAEEQLTLVGHEGLAIKAASGPPPVPRMVVTTPPEVIARLAPPAARPVSAWIKVGAVSSAVVAGAGLALTIKFVRDIRYYDKQLDQYRRFPCADQPLDQSCKSDRMTRDSPLQRQQIEHAGELAREQDQFEKHQYTAMIVTGVATAASATLFYLWVRPSRASGPAEVASLQLLPVLGPGRQGMAAFVRF
jgi:hypothetical protein